MQGKVLITGLSCPGDKRVVTCKVRVVTRDNMAKIKTLQTGECLVTDDIKPEDHVDQDLERAAGIIQNTGGKGCHTNMFAFAHSIPAISDTYGQSGENATDVLKDGQMIELESFTKTVDVTKADGRVLRRNIGTVYADDGNGSAKPVPSGVGAPSLADIMKKWGVSQK